MQEPRKKGVYCRLNMDYTIVNVSDAMLICFKSCITRDNLVTHYFNTDYSEWNMISALVGLFYEG